MILGVDVGGTFTDAVLVGAGGTHTAKVPSTPADQSEGVMAAIAAVLTKAGAEPGDVTSFAHGMTVGTNALLEERGARTALVATAGFTDLLDIARQDRPHLYRLDRGRPAPLVPPDLRFGVRERIGPESVIEPLSADEAERVARAVVASGADAVAICLLFAHRDASHERLLADAIARLQPELPVSCSHLVLPRFREYERCSTTVIDAYLTPLLTRYLGTLSAAAVERGLPEPSVMMSSGGALPASAATGSGAWSVLSGPAGGAVATGIVAGLAGEPRLIGLDMGGTSCEVCLVDDGRISRTESRIIDGRVIQLPMVDVHTVGAGGGSIAWLDPGGALRVGPRSAGAEPGPAAYGRGGTEPTVTDANLLLGYMDAGSVRGSGVELDREAAEEAIGPLAERIGMNPEEAAAGILAVADQEMVRALRVVTVERGIDPRGAALVPFGGAGPLHAARLAAELGIERIICPRPSGVLSAFGLAFAEQRRDTARTVMLRAGEMSAERIAAEVEDLRALIAGDDDSAGSDCEVIYELRYRGQAFELPVPGSARPDPGDLAEGFAAEHERRYGYRDDSAPVELITIRLALVRPGPEPRIETAAGAALVRDERPARFGAEWIATPVLRGDPAPGTEATGPLIAELSSATLVVPPGWRMAVDEHGSVIADLDAERKVTR